MDDPVILMTGAAGIVGRVLSRELAHRRIIGINSIDADLADTAQFSSIVDRYQPDVLIHCAARGGRQPAGIFNQDDLINNLQIVENIRHHCDRFTRIINISSGAEYGLERAIVDVEEIWLNRNLYPLPTDSYGLSKRISWQIFENMENAVNVRIFGCFDPSEPDSRLLRRFVNWKTKNQGNFQLRQDRPFSWISVVDLATIIDSIVEDGAPSTINAAYPETASMLLSDFLNRWCKIHGVLPDYEIVDEIGLSYTCNSAIMQALIKRPLRGLDACLKDYT